MKTHEKLTEALYGSVKIHKPIDDSKSVAREFTQKKLLRDMV